MTNLRITALFLMLTCSGAPLFAGQAHTQHQTQSQSQPTSLFYERQVTITTLSGQPSANAAIFSTTAHDMQIENSQYTGASSSSISAHSVGATAISTTMTDGEQKKIIAFRKQQAQAAHKEEIVQLSQHAYAKAWLQATLGPKQQRIVKELTDNTAPLLTKLAKIIALYEYEFKGECEHIWKNPESLWGYDKYVPVYFTDGRSTEYCAYLSDGRIALGSGAKIKIWNPTSNKCELILEGHHDDTIWVLTGLPDGRLASGHSTGTIKIWDLTSDKCDLLKGHRRTVKHLTILKDGRLASVDSTGVIKIWNPTSNKCERTLEGHNDQKIKTWDLTGLPDGRLASEDSTGTIKIWDLTSGTCELMVEDATCLTVLPDSRLAGGFYNKTINIWNSKSNTCELILKGHQQTIICLTVLPDGRLASSSLDGSIKIWNTTSGTCELTLKGVGYIKWLEVLPDERLASLSSDYTLKIWS